jgi:hypothetical protein
VAFAAAAFVLIASGCGSSDESESTGDADTQAWCALVIKINTESGYMKDKTYVPDREISPRTWKAIVDANVAASAQLLAATPSSIKHAEARGLDWFAEVKANAYDRATPFGPFTSEDRGQIGDVERTNCGIRWST